MTASSVTSLSDNPASLLVCVNKTAAIRPILKKGQAFTVNILGVEHQDISNQCASKNSGEDRFTIGSWDSHDNLPFLKDAQAVFFCHVDNEEYEYGTHQIVVGRLVKVIVPDTVVDPLIYSDGSYRRLE